jgi:acetyl-CoA C-acetyltransferase
MQTDEYIKGEASATSLAALNPAFAKTGGTVTAGNASGLNDGAAMLLLMSASKGNDFIPVKHAPLSA